MRMPPEPDQNGSLFCPPSHPLRSLVDAEGNGSSRSGRRVLCDLIHGETRQLASDFKHVELSAAEGMIQKAKCYNEAVKDCDFQHFLNIMESLTQVVLHVPPGPPSNKGLDVQIHWYVFRGDDGDSDTARQVLDTWMDNVTLALKYSLSKDENRTDDCFWRESVTQTVILADLLRTQMLNIHGV